MLEDTARRVRAFTRAWTTVNDVLDESYLGAGYGLAEARIVYELSLRDGPTPLTELRTRLRLDPGYATRLVARLATDGLVARGADPADGRRQVLELTPAGRRLAATLDERSTQRVAALLSAVPDADRLRLAIALDDARAVLEPRPPAAGTVRIREAGLSDLGWVLDRHGVLYEREFGWGEVMITAVAAIVADLAANRDDPGQRGWIADGPDGRRLGSVYCCREDATTARLRLLLTEPETRGTGLGRRLVTTCLDFARSAGYTAVVLNTQDACVAARRIYAAEGFRLERSVAGKGFDPDGRSEDWCLELD